MFQVLFVPCSEAWKSFVLCYGMRPMSKLAHEVAVRPDLRIGTRPQLPRGFSLPAEALRLSVKCIMFGTALIMRHLSHGGKRKLVKCVLAGTPKLLGRCFGMYEKLAYKGFTSTPRYDIEGKVIYGTIDEIDGFASYEAKRADEVETAFRNAVDDYIDACEESGVDPKPKLLMLA